MSNNMIADIFASDHAHYPAETLEWLVVGSTVAFHPHPYFPLFYGVCDNGDWSLPGEVDLIGEVKEAMSGFALVQFQNSGRSFDIPLKVWNEAKAVVLIDPEESERIRAAFVAKYRR